MKSNTAIGTTKLGQRLPQLEGIKDLLITAKEISLFALLLNFYLLSLLVSTLTKKLQRWNFSWMGAFPDRVLLPIARLLSEIASWLDQSEKGSISQREIIHLAMRNIIAKKVRSLISIVGMAIGVATIVFLLSIGYGLQNLVISKIAKLNEMKQADVFPPTSSSVSIDDQVLAKLKDISVIDKVSPVISLVGRVNLNSSATDVVVYGVTTDYLKESSRELVKGRLFESNDIYTSLPTSKSEENQTGMVAGVTTATFGTEIKPVNFKIFPGEWVRVRSGPSINDRIIGYTKRVEGVRDGVEVWGGKYRTDNGAGEAGLDRSGNVLGRWIKASVPIWKKKVEGGGKTWQEGYFAEINIKIESSPSPGEVLGESIQTEGEIEKILLQATAPSQLKKKIISLPRETKKEVVINEALLRLLASKAEDLVGKEVKLKFIVVGNLMSDANSEEIESKFESYKVVGIISGQKNPVAWVPFIDLRRLGVDHYSQLRVIVKNKNVLAKAREQIEAMGYKTSSVVDTVARVKSLFGTVRIILFSLGMVALAVASLGMFNTLTVSLLERVREVGIMKAMGMKSREARDLFLTEAILMSFFGGILGIFLGSALGNAFGLILSAFSLFKGSGTIDISYLPLPFLLAIISLSLLVGFVTGIYPAKRSSRISALDALRYE